MPIYQHIKEPTSEIGIWSITETIDELIRLASPGAEQREQLSSMRSEKRRTQWLAVRALLKKLPHSECEIRYNHLGKPSLENNKCQLSITHSGTLVAVQLSTGTYCGIDVQAISPKIERLAEKFIHPKESAFIPMNNKVEYLNLIWTMKEAVFKHFGSDLEFRRQIHIQPFDLESEKDGMALVKTSDASHEIRLKWMRINDYFLTYLE